MPNGMPHINALTKIAEQGQSAAQIADAAVLSWRAIHGALSPVIGARGVHALYRRTLYLTRNAHPWLDGGLEATEPGDFSDLRATLARQTSVVAAEGHGALLQQFLGLLTSLIGTSLTERLLRPVWAKLPGGETAQDTTP